jgi:hypothetical protein
MVERGLKGVTIPSQVNGLSLDAGEFTPFYDLANKLGVPIFVHPALAPKGYSLLQDYQLPVILTREFDLAVAVTRLIAAGSSSVIPNFTLFSRILVVVWPATRNGSRGHRIGSNCRGCLRSISSGSISTWPVSRAVLSRCVARSKVFARTVWFSLPIIRRISTTTIRNREKVSTACASILMRFAICGSIQKSKTTCSAVLRLDCLTLEIRNLFGCFATI